VYGSRADAGRKRPGRGDGLVARECCAEVLAGLAEPYVLLYVASRSPASSSAGLRSRVEEAQAGIPMFFSRVKFPWARLWSAPTLAMRNAAAVTTRERGNGVHDREN